MSNSNIPDGDKKLADGQNLDADGIENKDKKQVSYETFDKAMSSLAKEKQARKDLEDKLQKITEQQMLAEGKKDELIESLKTKAQTLEDANKRAHAERILERFNTKVSEVAIKKGVKNPTIAQKMFSIKDFELDDQGGVDLTKLESKFDDLKKTDGYLFQQDGKKIADGNPKFKPDGITKENLAEISTKDLKDMYRKL